MVEKFRKFLKKSFSNGPKAKIMLGLIICIASITAILVSMRKTVNVSIDGKEETFVTYKGTVKDVLQEKGYEVAEADKVQPSVEANITDNEKISVKKAVPVKVVMAGEEREILTTEDTVEDMLLTEADKLKEAGVVYKDEDIVNPGKDAKITADMNVKIVNVQEQEEQNMEDIPFETEQTVDYNKVNTYREVTKPGAPGKKAIKYKVIKHDNDIISKEKVSETPVSEPQTQQITVGGAVEKVNRSGQTYLSKKTLYLQATAYCGGGITATGKSVVRDPNGISTIAVDPRVIPLGSLVEVSGYGLAVASDTGGAIKGNIIDIYLDTESECESWGRRNNVEVNIKAYPGEW